MDPIFCPNRIFPSYFVKESRRDGHDRKIIAQSLLLRGAQGFQTTASAILVASPLGRGIPAKRNLSLSKVNVPLVKPWTPLFFGQHVDSPPSCYSSLFTVPVRFFFSGMGRLRLSSPLRCPLRAGQLGTPWGRGLRSSRGTMVQKHGGRERQECVRFPFLRIDFFFQIRAQPASGARPAAMAPSMPRRRCVRQDVQWPRRPPGGW